MMYVILAAAKNEKFFLFTRDKLTPNCFRTYALDEEDRNQEISLQITWNTILQYYHHHNMLPDSVTLRVELEAARNQQAPDEQIPTDEFINAFIEFHNSYEPNIETAHRYLEIWLNSRKVLPKIESAARENILRLPEILDDAIREVQGYVARQTELTDIFQQFESSSGAANVIPCGLSFVDELIGGGIGEKEVAVLLGATGSGKTTLSVQMLCSAARYHYYQQQPKKMVIFSYEDNARRIINRAIAYSAQIPLKRLRSLTSLSQLSDAHNPQPYELAEFTGENASLIGEKERLEAVQCWLQNFCVADFSTSSSNRTAGCQGVPEIVSYLENLNSPIGLVVVDWAGIMVRRYLEANGKERDIQAASIRRLQALCDDLYRHVASRFNCGVVLVHQLSGEANKRPPTAMFTHADAEGCRTIAVTAWHAFVLGTKDAQTNVIAFRCTKTRSDKSHDYRLLYLDGEYARLVDRTRDFFIDSASKKIVDRRSVRDNTERSRRRTDDFDI